MRSVAIHERRLSWRTRCAHQYGCSELADLEFVQQTYCALHQPRDNLVGDVKFLRDASLQVQLQRVNHVLDHSHCTLDEAVPLRVSNQSPNFPASEPPHSPSCVRQLLDHYEALNGRGAPSSRDLEQPVALSVPHDQHLGWTPHLACSQKKNSPQQLWPRIPGRCWLLTPRPGTQCGHQLQ